MSAPTVRWGVSSLIDGTRRRLHAGGKPWSTTYKSKAFREAAREADQYPDRDPKLVKVTKRVKPKVRRKVVREGTIERSGVAGWCYRGDDEDLWMRPNCRRWTPGTRVRVTYEELES